MALFFTIQKGMCSENSFTTSTSQSVASPFPQKSSISSMKQIKRYFSKLAIRTKPSMSAKITIITILSLVFCQSTFAQQAAEIDFIREHALREKKEQRYAFDFKAENEFQFVGRFVFTVYKKFISSQDAISCTFEPSCSVYGLHAIEHHGLLEGSLSTFDRLARCHGWNRGMYPIDPVTGRNLDPVSP